MGLTLAFIFIRCRSNRREREPKTLLLEIQERMRAMRTNKSLIVAAASVIVALALGGCTKPAPGPSSTTAPVLPATAADTAYCNKLIALYQEVAAPERKANGKYEVSVAEAINQCQSGNANAGIPTLESKLKEQRATLPAR
jgi:hypothetical protein